MLCDFTSAATTTFLCDLVGTPTRGAMPETWRPAKAPVPRMGRFISCIVYCRVPCISRGYDFAKGGRAMTGLRGLSIRNAIPHFLCLEVGYLGAEVKARTAICEGASMLKGSRSERRLGSLKLHSFSSCCRFDLTACIHTSTNIIHTSPI